VLYITATYSGDENLAGLLILVRLLHSDAPTFMCAL
jgi:hypothetical protein